MPNYNIFFFNQNSWNFGFTSICFCMANHFYIYIFTNSFTISRYLTERGHSTKEVDARLAELEQQERVKQTAVNSQLKTA